MCFWSVKKKRISSFLIWSIFKNTCMFYGQFTANLDSGKSKIKFWNITIGLWNGYVSISNMSRSPTVLYWSTTFNTICVSNGWFVFKSVCLSGCMYLRLSLSLSVRLSICCTCTFVYLSVRLSIRLSICLYVCLSICTFVDLSIYLSV